MALRKVFPRLPTVLVRHPGNAPARWRNRDLARLAAQQRKTYY